MTATPPAQGGARGARGRAARTRRGWWRGGCARCAGRCGPGGAASARAPRAPPPPTTRYRAGPRAGRARGRASAGAAGPRGAATTHLDPSSPPDPPSAAPRGPPPHRLPPATGPRFLLGSPRKAPSPVAAAGEPGLQRRSRRVPAARGCAGCRGDGGGARLGAVPLGRAERSRCQCRCLSVPWVECPRTGDVGWCPSCRVPPAAHVPSAWLWGLGDNGGLSGVLCRAVPCRCSVAASLATLIKHQPWSAARSGRRRPCPRGQRWVPAWPVPCPDAGPRGTWGGAGNPCP